MTHGYYLCGQKQFHNKFQAILYAASNHTEIKFCFNDAIFDQYNWEIEPVQTLNQLYARRAVELREQYDHLVLHFSGGYDSGNILETFVKNNIPIDEIYIRGSTSTSVIDINCTRSENAYAEVELIAKPLAEYVKSNYMPHVKITLQDTVDHVLKGWNNPGNWIDTLDISDFSPSTIVKKTYDKLNPDYRKLTEAGKKVGHIVGMEKPDMYYANGKYYTRFLDKFSLLHTPYRDDEVPMHIEPFYWAPTCAEMIIKQCHTIKKHITQHGLDPEKIFKFQGTEKHHFLGKIVYDRSFPMPFYPDKGTTEVRTTDYFFFKDQHADYYLNWKKTIDHIRAILPTQWVHDSLASGVVGMYSQSYCIGK